MTGVQTCALPIYQLEYPTLAGFSINNQGTRGPGSVGLEIGGQGYSDVLKGSFKNLGVGGFDVGTQIGGDHGCTCYNRFDQVDSTGVSYGVSTVNFSKYIGDANSNTWTGGIAWGQVGLSDVGGGKNHWIGIDIESSHKHGIVLAGYGNEVISPYEEANGCDLIDGNYNMITGPLAYGGGHWTPCRESKSTNSFWWGPDATPNTIGVRTGVLFGSPTMDNTTRAEAVGLTLAQGAGKPLTLAFDAGGSVQKNYGLFGAAPLSIGKVTSEGGIADKGYTTINALPAPHAPSVTNVGAPGSETYQYAIVCHDWNGGLSTISPTGSTTSGNAALNSENYNVITWNCGSGYITSDILKKSSETWQLLTKTDTRTSSADYFPTKDTGQLLTAYPLPTRNTTGDVSIAGQFSIGSHPVLPYWLTGYQGNSSGTKVLLASTTSNSAGQIFCTDANGNATTTGCSGGLTPGGTT